MCIIQQLIESSRETELANDKIFNHIMRKNNLNVIPTQPNEILHVQFTLTVTCAEFRESLWTHAWKYMVRKVCCE